MNMHHIIQSFTLFSQHPGISEIISDLKALNASTSNFLHQIGLFKRTTQTNHVDLLRSKLLIALNNPHNTSEVQYGVYLTDAIYDALLALAELAPLNTEDPVSMQCIPKNKAVFISTGHQFNIDILIDYHNARTSRQELREERDNYKRLLNPLTNAPFSYQDSAHIQNVAKQHRHVIQWLVNENSPELSVRFMAEQKKKHLDNNAISIDELAESMSLAHHRASEGTPPIVTDFRAEIIRLRREQLHALLNNIRQCRDEAYNTQADLITTKTEIHDVFKEIFYNAIRHVGKLALSGLFLDWLTAMFLTHHTTQASSDIEPNFEQDYLFTKLGAVLGFVFALRIQAPALARIYALKRNNSNHLAEIDNQLASSDDNEHRALEEYSYYHHP
tara:strand:+ start:397 stop:1560 length:1164 start_codon:yes stop_codon:yes gene_type:complete